MKTAHDGAAVGFAHAALSTLFTAPARTAAVAAAPTDDGPIQPVFDRAFFAALAPANQRQAA